MQQLGHPDSGPLSRRSEHLDHAPNTDRTVLPPDGRLASMDNDEIMTMWCRMRSGEAALAHRMMTAGAVQWSGQTSALDSVIGPDAQERFITDHHKKTGDSYTARVFADVGARFAYTWDVRVGLDEEWTGFDFNVTTDGLIDENWTFVASRHCDATDPEPAPAAAADLQDVCDRWIRVWAGETDLVQGLVSEDVSVYLAAPDFAADDLRGPAELADLITNRWANAGKPQVAVHREPVLDAKRGRVAMLWTDSDDQVGGDLLAVRDGRVTRAWSFSATRPISIPSASGNRP